ncbi:MAG: glycoside hydrolase family 127 protein [Bacteroidales bacterium]|nr:glycoside hydrolase family 127 protein [Bacteroidales bacterium]MCM1147361.1 glycoside hydrolase family 127 protein [Bacteroidales bacterium]MCM1206203.1 glycoside hydrolase family 127 protein [Bacillota bacterium]MCM1510437.1 glycoside hydrolase family 127 protein [Clostridium sp.]
MKRILTTLTFATALSIPMMAQQNGLVDMHTASHSVMVNTPLGATQWTGGFWKERFDVFHNNSIPSMFETWKSKEGKGWNNFLVASGKIEGEHHGPAFHDGDMYKWCESLAAVYAVTKDPQLDKIMDEFISLVAASQREDGYIHTQVNIAELNAKKKRKEAQDNTVVGTAQGTGADGALGNKLNFETYNIGHLINAALVHKRATGKTNFYDVAIKAAEFLVNFAKTNPDELAKCAVCPSHYMAVAELYRETGDKKYLDLAQTLIDIRGSQPDGTDDNQDREAFREQYNAIGHAVRANYLYAGVADLYSLTGEAQLMKNLTSIWDDQINRKMYITGGCGALYNGVSPDGTDYKPANWQQVHQAFGRPYQLPQSTAHNETCANIGNMLFNWRMLETTGDAKYADIVETCLYNSVLTGISLDGTKYLYTNPMRLSKKLPYQLRWSRERQKLISCFCCPPNTLRTVCEAQEYAYTVASDALFVQLYGENTLATALGKKALKVSQKTDYPFDGRVEITIDAVGKGCLNTVNLRVPGWCDNATVTVNGETQQVNVVPNSYIALGRNWKKGDKIVFDMEMKAKLIESNPLVEESRGEVAVKRGPLVYCLEEMDIDGNQNMQPGSGKMPSVSSVDIDNIVLPMNIKLSVVDMDIAGSRMKALEGTARYVEEPDWKGTLYREVSRKERDIKIRLIPHYAYGNRGLQDFTIFMPLAR